MGLAVVLLGYVGLDILHAGPLDLPQLTGECRATRRVRQVAWFSGRVHVNSGPSALVGLSSRFSSTLDASSSVFLSSVVKDLALIAASSRIRRRRGVVVDVDPASRRFRPSGRGVHGSCTPGSLVAISPRLANLPRPRCRRLLRSVVVGEGDETLDGGPPVVGLVCRWREIEEQLSSS